MFSIDISDKLSSAIPINYYLDYIQSIDENATSIILPNRTCNDLDYTIFDFSRFTLVESIEIGNHCFEHVNTFVIDGLSHLRSLKIGRNSFTKSKNGYECNQTCSFHLLNCNELESIEIGPGSFYDYGGAFELKNLFRLLSIKIGEIGSSSSNFFCSSFIVESTIIASVLGIDLPNLSSISLGDGAFYQSLSTKISSMINE